MLNWTLRYLPVVGLLDDAAAESVLDVGSGWHGLSSYRGGRVVQTDLAFDGARPLGDPPGAASYICASADRLPFRNAAFDVVVSLDLMEHLPQELRGAAVAELTRVSNHLVLLGFPAGEAAARVDRRLERALRVTRRVVPPWLSEHRSQSSYPDRSTVSNALPVGWWIEQELPLGNTWLTLGLGVAEELPLVHRATRPIDRWYRKRGPFAIVNRGSTYRLLVGLVPIVGTYCSNSSRSSLVDTMPKPPS